MHRNFFAVLAMLVAVTFIQGCSKSGSPGANDSGVSGEVNASPIPFEPYTIIDSSKIVNYEDGLQLYTVVDGPGEFPIDGMDILVHYHGMLANGDVFDSSYQRGEPLKVRLGRGKLIQGFEYSLKQLRMGSKAIAIIPPELGYGSKDDVPNVPPNSTLNFHLEVLGTF